MQPLLIFFQYNAMPSSKGSGEEDGAFRPFSAIERLHGARLRAASTPSSLWNFKPSATNFLINSFLLRRVQVLEKAVEDAFRPRILDQIDCRFAWFPSNAKLY